jgi:hypothetical protein
LKDRILTGARRRVDLVGRKIAQPLDGRNVVVGSCPIRQLVGDQGENAKGRTSVERKVPSSEACLDEVCWPTTVGRGIVYQMADGEVIGRKPVIVLEELEQGDCNSV